MTHAGMNAAAIHLNRDGKELVCPRACRADSQYLGEAYQAALFGPRFRGGRDDRRDS
jgi:hypothetical protein